MHALPLLYCNEGVLFRYEKIMISITYEKFTAISISINVRTCNASHCVIDLCFVFCVLCFVFRVLCLACVATVCATGTYGAACSQVCNCQNGAACDVKTGVCTCTAGYMGTNCSQGQHFTK